jgi:hypothetical protein
LPPPKPYRRVYHLTSTEHAISDISLRRLKLARIADLNDPFELRSVSFRDKPVRKAIKEYKNAFDSTTGLLCFSGNWTNPVLWSHYGQKHRGICLGFDVLKNRLERVQYKDDRLRTELDENVTPLDLDSDLQQLLRCTKFRHWQYEAEWRWFIKLVDAQAEGRFHFLPFDDSLKLAEVILGPDCVLSMDHVTNVVSSQYSNVVTFHARLAWRSFTVVPKESSVP